MENNKFIHIHPGRVILEEFLAPRGISAWRLAKDLGLPLRRVYELVQGQRSINTDIAHRLAHYFGMSERFWLNLQARYDREIERTRFPHGIRPPLRHAGF